MKAKEKSLEDIVRDSFLGINHLYVFEKKYTTDELKADWESKTFYSGVGIMRRAINGAKYHDTLSLNIGNFWDNTGLSWLVEMGYLNNYTGIYLPTKSGVDWFNSVIDKISKEEAGKLK